MAAAFIAASVIVAAPAEASYRGTNGRIAFVSDRYGNLEIFTMGPLGRDERRITRHPAVDLHPDWSPKGKAIAFASDRSGRGFDVFVMRADGSQVRRLTTDGADDLHPDWSPKGKRIAFDRQAMSGMEGDIYVMSADGTRPRRLTNADGLDRSPVWSPKGNRIAFESNRDGDFEIYVMRADGTRVRRLTRNRVDDLAPDWSPSGRRIAFAHQVKRYDYDIVAIRVDCKPRTCKKSRRRLTRGPATDFAPAWSPDGRKVAFDRRRRKEAEVFTVKASGGRGRRLTRAGENLYPSWQAR